MNHRVLYDVALSLGANPDSQGFVVKRADIAERLKAQGFADRTIANHLAPSRSGGLINMLLARGLITDGGNRRWVVPCMRKLKDHLNTKSVKTRFFRGNPPPDDSGWTKGDRLDDWSDPNIEWRLFYREYAPGCHNLKVVSMLGRTAHKANYWLQSKNGVLVTNKNTVILKKHHPEIYESLIESVQDL